MQKESMDADPFLKLSFDVSLLGIENCFKPEEPKSFAVAHQLLLSETAIGANAFEARSTVRNRAGSIYKEQPPDPVKIIHKLLYTARRRFSFVFISLAFSLFNLLVCLPGRSA